MDYTYFNHRREIEHIITTYNLKHGTNISSDGTDVLIAISKIKTFDDINHPYVQVYRLLQQKHRRSLLKRRMIHDQNSTKKKARIALQKKLREVIKPFDLFYGHVYSPNSCYYLLLEFQCIEVTNSISIKLVLRRVLPVPLLQDVFVKQTLRPYVYINETIWQAMKKRIPRNWPFQQFSISDNVDIGKKYQDLMSRLSEREPITIRLRVAELTRAVFEIPFETPIELTHYSLTPWIILAESTKNHPLFDMNVIRHVMECYTPIYK
jgi:hypothetical protein